MTKVSVRSPNVARIVAENREWISKRCNDGKCQVKSNCDGRTSFFVDCEKYKVANKITNRVADCLYVECRGAFKLAAIELKGGGMDVRHAVDQIKNCLSQADKILSGQEVAKWNGALLHRGINTNEVRLLRKLPVTFRGRTKPGSAY